MNRKWLGLIVLGVVFSGAFLAYYIPLEELLPDSEGDGSIPPSITPISETAQFNVTSSGDFFDGYNVFLLERAGTEGRLDTIVVVDMDGNVIQEHDISFDANHIVTMPVEFINTTTILTGGPDGAQLWNIRTNTTYHPGIEGHHEYEYNPNDDTIFIYDAVLRMANNTIYECDVIREYDLEGNLVWSLDTSDFISFNQWCPYEDRISGNPDLTHCNTIFYDADEDIIYMNSRNTNTFYKIDHSSGEIVWGLGEYGDFRLFDSQGRERSNLFYHAHSVEKIDNNQFILFDNDLHNQSNPNNQRSRIVEIIINEETMTANESWSWTAPLTYYSEVWGDADRLPNGNRLGTFGTRTHPNTTIGARLVEVNSTGEIVWEMNFPRVDDGKYGVYRMERIGFSPFLSSPQDISVLPSQDASVTWQTWYNYRPKRTIHGSYSLLLNGTEWEQGPLSYDKFWRYTNLTFDLDSLSYGTYNLTLIVDDGAGHTTADSINASIVPYYIQREGPSKAEIGSGKSISWDGATVDPLNYTVLLNGTAHKSGVWTGQEIGVDADSLSPGVHLIRLELTNDTELEFGDEFWFTAYPQTSPNVTPLFGSPVSIVWGKNSTLSWSVFDRSHLEWFIYVNGTIADSGMLSKGQNLLNWSVPRLGDGFYNVTLEVTDLTGYSTATTSWFSFEYLDAIVIDSIPEDTTISWDYQDAKLLWEVYGGMSWEIFKNGSSIESGIKNDTMVGLTSIDWRADDWRPAIYNITLLVAEGEQNVTSTIFVETYVKFGDAYADAFLSTNSAWYSHGENAVGKPDGQYAELFLDYGNGYITLDMGKGEEISDGSGNDLKIIGGQGEYRVYVSRALDQMFDDLGTGSGNQSYDLASSGLDGVRYVRLEYSDGDSVEIDSVLALNYEAPESDNAAPVIEAPADFWVYSNESSVVVDWSTNDYTPWNYSIYVNGNLTVSGYWNGSDISYSIDSPQVGVYSVKLVLFDVFSNRAEDVTTVEVRSVTDQTSPPFNPLFVVVPVVAGFAVTTVIWLLYRRSTNPSSNALS